MATAKKYQAWKQSLHDKVEATKLQQRTVKDPEEEASLLASLAK